MFSDVICKASFGMLMSAWWVLFLVAFLLLRNGTQAAQKVNPGGTFLALAGKDSVVLATDSRCTNVMNSGFLLDHRPRDIYRVGCKTLVGCYGVDMHAEILMQMIRLKVEKYRDHELNPANIARLIANTLYHEENFILNPIVVGMDSQGLPYICSMDGLGAETVSRSFAVVGTANQEVLSLCESLYSSDLEAHDLVRLASRCLRLAFQRNILSGGNIKIVTLKQGVLYSQEVELQDV